MVEGTHWLIPKAELRTPLDELRRRLTIMPKYKGREPLPAFIETPKFFGVPRHYANIGTMADKIVDMRCEGQDISFEMVNQPRPRQVPILQEFCTSVQNGSTGILLEAPTGSGKTYCSMNFLQYLKKTALIIVPRDRIVEQWVEAILEHTNLTRDEIGIAQGPKCQFEGKKIVVGMIHSLSKDKYPKEFKKYFGVVVWDEVHTVSAETFSKTLTMFPAKYRIGVSATPDRKDGFEKLFLWHIAGKVIKMQGTTEVTPKIFVRQYEKKYKEKHPYLNKVVDKVNRRGIILSELAKDSSRNRLIAMFIQKFHASGRRTLMLSDREEQIQAVKQLLIQCSNVPEEKIGIFTGKTKKAERQRVLDESEIILATYGVFNMAIDVPDLRALVYGTPLSDARQAAGRILRLCEGTKEPVILDLVDTDYKDTQGWAVNRRSTYLKMKAEIVEMHNGN